ncbi:MAG TPA: glucose-1-phosphate adenylyltransferase family protein [bacterium]|nr:glucose-1-phosphate adenylyltransferase family protein [bacterium]
MTSTMLLPRDTLAMILAGGRVNELAALTIHRPKSAMPFGGIYRVIDCALSNLASSGINRIGILSQYRPLSLMDHVRDGRYWDFQGFQRGVTFLPPHTGESDSDWYKGTADALYQNISFIEHFKKPLTLVLSGDHIYRMDYHRLFEIHNNTGAEMTMAVTRVPQSVACRYGLAEIDDRGMVTRYLEKPVEPISSMASMTVYLFNTDVLIRELRANARTGKTFQIYDEILPKMVARGTVAAHCHDDYWSYSRSLEDYFNTNMDCLGDPPVADLSRWRLFTNHDAGRIGDPPPLLAGIHSRIVDSMISPGCIVHGSVSHSILSPRVIVEEGAEISDSVIFDGTVIRAGAVIQRSIIDKNAVIGRGTHVGCGKKEPGCLEANRVLPNLLQCGLTVIGKRAVVPADMMVGTNVLIYPDVAAGDFRTGTVPHGATILPE